MTDCNPKYTPSPSGAELFEHIGEPLADATEYMSIVRRFIYLSTHTRPDLKFVTSRLCQFSSNPTDHYLAIAKHALRYLKATANLAIHYTANGPNGIEINCDADHANDKTTSKSVTGVCVQLFGNLVEWQSQKQARVSKATCQAEVLAIEKGIDSEIYLRDVLSELTDVNQIKFTLYNDNESAIKTIPSGGDILKNKSYRTNINKIKDILDEKWCTLVQRPSAEMPADFLTKRLSETQLKRLISLVGIY